MYISKKSWHYRFLKFFEKDIPYGLCEYVKSVFKMLFLLIATILFFLSMAFMLGATALRQFGIEISAFDFVDVVLSIVSGIVGCVLISITFIGAIVGCEKLSTKNQNSLVFNYIKAKKSKICPRIEFKD